MSAARKAKPVQVVPPWLRQFVAVMLGPGRTLTLAILVVGVFSGGAVAVWRHVDQHVTHSADYLVRVEQIAITPQPEWIRSDVRAEAFRTACSPDHPLSSLDDNLAQRIHMAFTLHPWVAKAAVTKRAGARISVDLVYRRPVCMVEVASGTTVDLLPVDGDGVWLPGEDFSQKQKESYPCLAGIDQRPIQPVGHAWGNPRVVEGATIAAALLPVWQQLKLYRIQPVPTPAQPATGGDRGPLLYELYTRAGTRITWGNPRGGTAGEPTAEEKSARLVQYAASHNGLDAGPSLDVRKIASRGS